LTQVAAGAPNRRMELTKEFLSFRECARHTWNAYFQPLNEGWHEFINVEAALFEGLVLARFEPRPGLVEKHPAGYFEALAVCPIATPRGVPALHAQPRDGQTTQWEETRLAGDLVETRFIEFFDFADFRSPRDFKWVRARVVGPPNHALMGEDLLLETEYVEFHGLT
jgi:hypothetical protein